MSYKTDFVPMMTTLCVKFSADDGLYATGLFLRILRQHQNPGHLMEMEQSVLAVELEPTDHVCVCCICCGPAWSSVCLLGHE